MFDVIWTDPDRELLGEHRAKKEKQREEKKKSKKRSSLSTKRSSLSSNESPFSFLRSHGLTRNNTPDSKSKSTSKSPASSRFAPSISSARSPHSTSFDAKSRPGSGLAATCISDELASATSSAGNARGAEDDQSPGLSLQDSIFSKYAESDIATSCSAGDASVPDNRKSSRGNSAKPDLMNNWALLQEQPQSSSKLFSKGRYENATWPRTSKKSPPPIPQAGTCSSLIFLPGPLPTIPPLKSIKDTDPNSWNTTNQRTTTLNNKNPTIAVLADMLAKCNSSTLGLDMKSSLDIKSWRQEIDRMSSVEVDDVVLRLKEICGIDTNHCPSAEEEVEAARWMIWALHHVDPEPETDHSSSHPHRKTSVEVSESVLMLNEPQDITVYHAALHPTKQIDHMSPHPMPSNFAPNLDNILVRSNQPADFPPAGKNYDVVVSYSLPSAIPAPEIPSFLSKINSYLRPGGTFQLLIIDPVPRAATAGPHLRAWLRNNLLANIKSTSHCLHPSKSFPHWLADASLRGDGSTITTTKFFAIPTSVRLHALSGDDHLDPLVQKAQNESIIKAEARSLIGRLLWKQIWAPFTICEKWWWDDPACVRECLELGTIWEYHMIEAIKDDVGKCSSAHPGE